MSVPEPSKILTPWATSGLKNTIPETANPVTGNAGYDQGFPAINMTAKEAGGIPPFGQDFNGIFFAITEALRYIQAGGSPTFSTAMASSIGGYAKGAVVIGSDGDTLYQNTTDNNTANPNSGGSGWVNLIFKSLPKRSFSSNDFIRIPDTPGGLIIQWGEVVCSATATTPVNFPVQFPTSLFSMATSIDWVDPGYVTLQSQTNIGFSVNAWDRTGARTPRSVRFFAVGF